MKLKPRHYETFWMYVRWRFRHPIHVPVAALVVGSVDPIRAFTAWDSTGRMPPTSHPRAVTAAIQGKAALNLQIKDWAQGFFECGARSWLAEAQADLPWLSAWVWDAVAEQAYA